MKGLHVLALVILGLSSTVTADVPMMINYQGRLTDSLGKPLDTTVSMTFAIYDDSSAGNQLWQEAHADVDVVEGLFHLLLGSTDPIPESVFGAHDAWLDMIVGGEAIEPRTRLVSVAYAYRVGSIDGAEGGTVSGDVSLTGGLGLGASTDSAMIAVDADTQDRVAIWARSAGWPVIIAQKTGGGDAVNILKEGYPGYGLWLVQKATSPALVIGWDTTEQAESMVIFNDGRTGIGTTNPIEKLEVVGTVYSSVGGFRFPDGTVQTTAATSSPPSQFGEWETRLFGVTYQASTDGFVVATIGADEGGGDVYLRLEGYTDSSNPPTTLRAASRDRTGDYDTDESVFFPVRGGDFWRVIKQNDDRSALHWMPLEIPVKR